MKKIVFLSAILCSLAVAVNAQTTVSHQSQLKPDHKAETMLNKEKKEDRKEIKKLKGTELSYQAKQAFMSDFGKNPGTKWTRLDNFDEATFKKDGQTRSAFYDADSKLVGTTQAKAFTDLPLKGQANIRKDYKGYKASDVLFYDDNEMNETDMILFGNQFAAKDCYFVELTNNKKKMVVQVTMNGDVSYFSKLK